MKRQILLLSTILLALFLIVTGCEKRHELPTPSQQTTKNPVVNAGKGNYYGVYMDFTHSCMPMPNTYNCIEVVVHFPRTDMARLINDIDNSNQGGVHEDLINNQAEYEDLFGTPNMEGLLNGTSTIGHVYSPELLRHWFIFTPTSGTNIQYVGVDSL